MSAEKPKTADIAVAMPARYQPDGRAPGPDDKPPAGTVSVPALCDRHLEELERDLSRPLGGLVVAPYMVVAVLLFQVATHDPALWAVSADVLELGEALTRAGCPACRYPRAFRSATRVARRRGLKFAAALSRNEETSALWRPDVYAVDRR